MSGLPRKITGFWKHLVKSLSNPNHIHIVGLGLIGGSIAGGLRESSYRVTGWDKNEEARQKALDRDLIESIHAPNSLPSSVSGVILAVPVPKMVSIVDEILLNDDKPKFITDVGSTKREVCQKMKSALPDGIPFIGTHPMAGSEKSGLEASNPILFENAICVITPIEPDQQHLLDVIQLWETLGAHVFEMSPEEHDRSVAYISHLPHLVASVLLHGVETVPDFEENLLPLAAGGFKDTTRIAEGDPDLWRDIFQTNKEKILNSIQSFSDELDQVRQLIKNDAWSKLTDWLDSARNVRKEIPEKTKGLLGTLFELKILAPDKPGILAHITGTLSEASINISDIEVLRVREGELGTIRLRFRSRDQLERARGVLTETREEIKII